MKIVRVNAIWCPACIVMKKIWKKIEEQHSNIEYIDLDYDIDEEEIEPLKVGTLLPVAIFYKNDVEIQRLNGEKTEEEILNIIKEVL